jgi:hypothetical protein
LINRKRMQKSKPFADPFSETHHWAKTPGLSRPQKGWGSSRHSVHPVDLRDNQKIKPQPNCTPNAMV